MPTRDQIEKLLQDPEFRREFVADYVQEMVATQIRALRARSGLSQGEIGKAAKGMSQVQVSRLEDPDYSGATVNSLKRIAQAFDVGLIVRLAPFSEFVDWIVNVAPDSLAPDSYDEEQYHGRTRMELMLGLADASFEMTVDADIQKIPGVLTSEIGGERIEQQPITQSDNRKEGVEELALAA